MKDQHEYELAQCALNPDMDRYNKFRRIPSERVSESSLVAWIVYGGILEEIPKEHRTERVVWAAARHDDTAYNHINIRDVSDHRALSLDALFRSKVTFYNVPECHKDEDFLIQMTIKSTDSIQGVQLADNYAHLLTDKVAQAICSRSMSHAYGFWVAGGQKAKDLIKDEYLERAFENHLNDYAYLERFKKEHLLVAKLATGFWPEIKAPGEPAGPPADPMAALILFENTKLNNYRVLYKCWLLSRPIEEVIESLQVKPVGLDKVFELYPDSELRKHMKTFRSIRGRFLEHDLGM